MSPITCDAFRAHLEQTLRGHPEHVDVRPFAWHEHLLACADCRALLEAEEALEELLASLPAPQLPSHLATRVLARLVAHRGRDLDHLLDLDHAPAPPADLAPRILAGLSDARRAQRADEGLDGLLELVPAPEVPAGLEDRVLAALDAERRAPVRFRLLTGGVARRVAAAAAVLVLGFFAWRLFFGTPAVMPDEPSPDAPADAELIAALDVLQYWDVLMSDDPNLQLVSIGAVDEALFEAADVEDPDEADATPDEKEG